MDGVGTSIVGRPRRLSADRRARPTYTLIWEEPGKLMLDKVGPGAQVRRRVTLHFENISDQVAKIAVADWKAGSPSLSQANVLVIPPGQTREVLWGHDVSVEELRRTVGEDPETARVALTFHVRDNALSTHDVIKFNIGFSAARVDHDGALFTQPPTEAQLASIDWLGWLLPDRVYEELDAREDVDRRPEPRHELT